VLGIKAYPSVKDLPEPVDLVVIAIPFQHVLDVVKDCVTRGAKAGIIITAGLGEAGKEGAELQREIVRVARSGGMRLVGPNTMGNLNMANGFSTTFEQMAGGVRAGHVGIISQSGTFAGRLLQTGTEMGVGFSKFVGTGNEADLHLEDFLEYLAKDDDTQVITCYIEGLREGRRFMKIAEETTKRKPILVMKVGRTKAGSKAAMGHTSAIAGSDAAYDALFKQTGVIRVAGVEELFDTAMALLKLPLPKGNHVGILTMGGGGGCIASDACELAGLDVATLSPETIERLNAILPPRWPHANPVDTVAAGLDSALSDFDNYNCLWPLMEDDNLDALLTVDAIGMSSMAQLTLDDLEALPVSLSQYKAIAKKLEDKELANLDKMFAYMDKLQKPVLATGGARSRVAETRVTEKCLERGIVIYPTPERAARVMANLVKYGNYLRRSD